MRTTNLCVASRTIIWSRQTDVGEPLQPELDALMVVVVDVIMHAPFVRINAIRPLAMEVLGFQGAEEVFNRRVVDAVVRLLHGSILSEKRASSKAGAVYVDACVL